MLLCAASALHPDNQLYVVTCSPARDPDFSYQAWVSGMHAGSMWWGYYTDQQHVCQGHSTVISPWGEVVATTGHEPDTVWLGLLLRCMEVMQNSRDVIDSGCDHCGPGSGGRSQAKYPDSTAEAHRHLFLTKFALMCHVSS